MKKLLFISLLLFCSIYVQCLEVSIEVGSFKNENQSYLETYIRVLGGSTKFKLVGEKGNLLQAGVEFTLIISQLDKIVAYERYVLNSPLSKEPKDFLDVKRFALPKGKYTLKLEAVDIHDADNKITLEKQVSVNAYIKSINLSDVQLLGSVTATDASNPLAKNGLLMEPLTYGFVSPDIQVLNIYAEIYKTKIDQKPYFIRYAIMDGYTNGVGGVSIQKFKKLAGKEREPILLKLPLDKLPSGKYHVLVELFDKKKTTLASRKVDFIRSNPDYDVEYWKSYNKNDDYSFVSEFSKEDLNYALRAISAIVYEPKKSLMNFMIKDAPIKAQRKFLLDFWNENAPTSPEFSYQKYMDVVKAIDLEYNSNVGYGFETDRGYIFLRYGKPNNVLSVDTEPDSYPYEIWYYNYVKETNQTNVRFIFYNKSLAHNDYATLHSTCIGERQNPAWEIELYRKGLEVPNTNAIDGVSVGDGWQRSAKRYFNEY